MNHRNAWESFSARIRGLMGAARFHATLRAVNTSDSFGRHKVLAETFSRLLDDLIAFEVGAGAELPQAARTGLNVFIKRSVDLVKEIKGGAYLKEEATQALLLMVAAFETEMTFLLSDRDEAIRSRVDRAFEHLQRMIVVDETFRNQWQEAFADGEVACERRGGVHLLAHGIWAFKVDGAGARTDLVYQEPIGDLVRVGQAAEGLVLTEWKKTISKTAAEVFVRARAQADIYRRDVLGGLELARYSYAVVVSEHRVHVPADLLVGNVTWRHVNIAVCPGVPSRDVRKS